MMSVQEEVEKSLSIFKNFYDFIRIVDPIKKQVIYPEYKNKEEINVCYKFWDKGENCNNCICFRSLIKDDTFLKIESKDGKVYMITSCIFNKDNKKYVLELIKDLSDTRYLIDEDKKLRLELLIEKINDELSWLYNKWFTNKGFMYIIIGIQNNTSI